MVDVNWDERYLGEAENRPWDSGVVEPELKACIAKLSVRPARALEIGCGTGTNSIWLAEQGIDTLGTEIAPNALDAANKKIEGKILPLRFVQHDICASSPVQPGSIDFVFDRGVFHVMSPEQRSAFVKNVAQSLSDGGLWFCLAGSADETKPADKGPPRLTASELLGAVETEFEVQSLHRSHFELPDGSRYAAWSVLLKKRA